jgi:hypothetical protein
VSSAVLCADFDVVDDDAAPFFAPVAHDLVDQLVGQYAAARQRIEGVAAFTGEALNQGVMDYFISGNMTDDRGRSMLPSAKQLFQADGAIRALNSAYWSKALALTDVLDTMPQKRRDEWHESIRQLKTPDFTGESARSTLGDLLRMRGQFLAERVDGIFRGLSGEHVTNAPEAFGKRMIVARVLSEWGTSDYQTCGIINDLRAVIAKFMGRDEPKYNASDSLVRALKGRWGEWVPVDGGALRVRLYRKGTAHLEVHPDLAYRLNQVLASLYPLIIPASFRQKPKKKAKDYVLMGRPLPFRVLGLLDTASPAKRRVDPASSGRREVFALVPNTISLNTFQAGAVVVAEAEEIIRIIGGTKTTEGWFEFDYPPMSVIEEIVVSGCIPDAVAHQYYPTPVALAERVVALADIGPGHTCLEPSAGTGGLACLMPKHQTTCIEVASLNAKVLEAKGFHVTRADFLDWAKGQRADADRIVMNPPFSEGRARIHVEAAAMLLAPGGRLVAIVPASHREKIALSGCSLEWSEVIEGAFPGVSVAVVILVAVKG